MVVSTYHGPSRRSLVCQLRSLAVTALIAVLLIGSAAPAQWSPARPSQPMAGPVPGMPYGPSTPYHQSPALSHATAPYAGQPMHVPQRVIPGSTANPFAPTQSTPTVFTMSPIDRLLAQAAEHERNGNAYQAIEAYREALRVEPRHHNALLSYARMKHRAQDFDGAIILYGQILKYYPQNPIALNDLGLCFARKGDTAQAIATLSRAVQRRPDSQRYRNNLAVVLVGAGRHVQAYEVLASGGGPASANYNIAWMLNRQGKGQDAVPYLHAALMADPAFQPAIALLTNIESSPSYVAALPEDYRATAETVTAGKTEQSAGPVIQLRSGTEEDAANHPVRNSGWDGGGADMPQPPRVEDYTIPNL